MAPLAALALFSALAACGDDRPSKPNCEAGFTAHWDDDDNEWECERASRSSGGSGDIGRSRSGRRH